MSEPVVGIIRSDAETYPSAASVSSPPGGSGSSGMVGNGAVSLGTGSLVGELVVTVGSGITGETDGASGDDDVAVGLDVGRCDVLVGAGAGGRARVVVGPGRGWRAVRPDVGSDARWVPVTDVAGAGVAVGDGSTLGDPEGDGDKVGEGVGLGSADGDGDDAGTLGDGVGKTGAGGGSASTGRLDANARTLSTTARTPATTTPVAPQSRVLRSAGSCIVPRRGSKK